MPSCCRAISLQLVGRRHAGIVQEDVERLDLPNGSLNLRWICNVQGQGRSAPAGMSANGRRVPAYTRAAPLLNVSSTSACPRPRLAPVTMYRICPRSSSRSFLGPPGYLRRCCQLRGLASERRRSREDDLDRFDAVWLCARSSACTRTVVWPRSPGCGLSKWRSAQRRNDEGCRRSDRDRTLEGRWLNTCRWCTNPQVDSGRAGRAEQEMPLFVDVAPQPAGGGGCWWAVQRLHSTESATSVRVRGTQTEITDGPFASPQEVTVAGYYVLEVRRSSTRHSSRPRGSRRRATGRSRCARSCRQRSG